MREKHDVAGPQRDATNEAGNISRDQGSQSSEQGRVAMQTYFLGLNRLVQCMNIKSGSILFSDLKREGKT